MWDPRRLTTLWASAACYRDSFTLPYLTLPYLTFTVLVDLGRFFSFLNYTQLVGPLDGASARRKATTYIQNNTNTE
jgi:hypothetical protein